MRAQAHTLEAVIASLLMLSSVIFALQMTAVTPLSASTSSQHIENQQQAVSEGVLATAAKEGALKQAILYSNDSTDGYHGSVADGETVYTIPPPIRFGELINQSLRDRGIAYNVYFSYQTTGGNTKPRKYISSGEPSDNAVRATHTVTLVDDDHLYNRYGNRNQTEVGNTTRFYIDDTGANLYNTVRVEVVAWRI